MEDLWMDLKHAARLLRRRPAFTAVVALTLALGIGSTTALFSLVHGVLLRPLPFDAPDRLVTLWQRGTRSGGDAGKVSPGNFTAWRSESPAFASMASAEPYGFDLTEGGEPERIAGWRVSPGFFRVLGVQARHGDVFTPAQEAAADGEPVVIVSHAFWRRRLGGDAGAVGRTLLLSNRPHRVVGVMPPEFDFPPGRDLWVARAFAPQQEANRTETNLTVIARLAPGETLERARVSLDALSLRLAERYPETNRGVGTAVIPVEEHLVGGVRPGLLLLFFAVGFVHLLVCVNVANLVLVHGIERRNEFACRAALGAGRGRLARQLLTESLLMALLGVVPGVWLAGQAVALVVRLGARDIPRLETVAVDPIAIAFAVALAAASGLLFGLAPLWRASRTDLARDLGPGAAAGRGIGRSRWRRYLIAFESSLAVMLLLAAGLLARSFGALLDLDPGFQTTRVAAAEAHVWARYPDPASRAAFFREASARIASRSDIAAAGAVSALPLFRGRNERQTPFVIEGREPPPADQPLAALHTVATAGYFPALGIAAVRGRLFEEADDADGRAVALVNQAFVRAYWPHGDPIGARLVVRFQGPPAAREIVGIVGDARQESLARPARPEIFIPHAQSPSGSMTFVARSRVAGGDVARSIKDAVREGAPGLPFTTTVTMEKLVADSLAPRRLSLMLLTFFSGVALVLAGLGVYGMVGSSTAYRKREIGLRLALGGEPRAILGMILKEHLLWIFGGVVAGCAAAVALTRVLEKFLFGVRFLDPPTLAGVALVMSAVGALATFLPARLVLRQDPTAALRHD